MAAILLTPSIINHLPHNHSHFLKNYAFFRVQNIMKKDSEKDPETNPSAVLAQLLINQVDRKLVKQTVMTSVYVVTYVGARERIKKRLEEKSLISDEADFCCFVLCCQKFV